MSETETNSEAMEQTSTTTGSGDAETLVVVSKIKKLIRAQSGLNTGQCAVEALSRKIMDEITRGIENARKAGRKTVMGRDIL